MDFQLNLAYFKQMYAAGHLEHKQWYLVDEQRLVLGPFANQLALMMEMARTGAQKTTGEGRCILQAVDDAGAPKIIESLVIECGSMMTTVAPDTRTGARPGRNGTSAPWVLAPARPTGVLDLGYKKFHSIAPLPRCLGSAAVILLSRLESNRAA